MIIATCRNGDCYASVFFDGLDLRCHSGVKFRDPRIELLGNFEWPNGDAQRWMCICYLRRNLDCWPITGIPYRKT